MKLTILSFLQVLKMAASMGIKTQACLLCRIPAIVVRRMGRSSSLRRFASTSIMPGETDIDPAALEVMEQRGVTFKGHPGIMTLKPVNLPEKLERAVETVIQKYPVHDLQAKTERLNNYLTCRHLPVETPELRESAEHIYNEVTAADKTDLSTLSKDAKQEHEDKIREKVLKILRTRQYHWKPIQFDAKTSVVYLKARLAYNYSSLLQCFSEIYRREPDFNPRTMFDLGSGLASSVWAGNKIWGSLLYEYYCVDSSRDMNTLARLLLQDGDEQKLMHIRGVHFRQFPPSRADNKFCLVVCGHTLLELPGQRERLDTITALWEMTQDYLILIENGSTAGFNAINEAKEHLLKLSEEKGGKMTGHVFAPCPHDEPCPKVLERNSACFFKVTYKPGKVLSGKESKQSTRYSYVIMKKGKRNDEDVRWPRIIQEVTKASRHVHCHLCCPNASLSHSIFTQKKHGKNMYKCSRYSSWGDLYPVVLPNTRTNTENRDTDDNVNDTQTENYVEDKELSRNKDHDTTESLSPHNGSAVLV